MCNTVMNLFVVTLVVYFLADDLIYSPGERLARTATSCLRVQLAAHNLLTLCLLCLRWDQFGRMACRRRQCATNQSGNNELSTAQVGHDHPDCSRAENLAQAVLRTTA